MKRKLGMGKNEICGLKDKVGNLITNMDRIVEVTEESYAGLYSSSNNPDGNDGGRGTGELDIPPVTKEEVTKALAALQRGKAAGEDQETADLLKDGGGDRTREISRPIYTMPEDLERSRKLEER